MEHSYAPAANGSSGHEHREANVKVIVVAAIGLAVAVAVVMVLMIFAFNVLKKEQSAEQVNSSPLAPAVEVPPEPRLEEHPWESMQQLHQREDHMLTTYGWQDQKAGIVRIPIDRAIELMAQRGITNPAAQPAAAKQAAKAGGASGAGK